MSQVTYEIVQHDGGYAYRVGDVFSEAYPTRAAAHEAAEAAAQRQQRDGETTSILYEDADGSWHSELARGDDHPAAEVEDDDDQDRPAHDDGHESHVRQVQQGSQDEPGQA